MNFTEEAYNHFDDYKRVVIWFADGHVWNIFSLCYSTGNEEGFFTNSVLYWFSCGNIFVFESIFC